MSHNVYGQNACPSCVQHGVLLSRYLWYLSGMCYVYLHIKLLVFEDDF